MHLCEKQQVKLLPVGRALPGQVEKGATAAVFGLGTIGLAVIDALREAGAKRIIAVDTDEGKFERAQKWGATDLVNPKKHERPIQARPRRLLQPWQSLR